MANANCFCTQGNNYFAVRVILTHTLMAYKAQYEYKLITHNDKYLCLYTCNMQHTQHIVTTIDMQLVYYTTLFSCEKTQGC